MGLLFLLSLSFYAQENTEHKKILDATRGNGIPSDLNITANVNSASTDHQEAQNKITANNTIFSGANAVYHAGNEVLLTSGFDALNNSKFRAYIEGCSGGFILRQSENETNEQTLKIKEEIIVLNDNDLIVYPNPTKGIINIKLKGILLDNSTIQVYSFSGALVSSNTISKKNVSSYELNLSNLQTGLYLIKVTLEGGKILSNKIVKNNRT